MKKLLAVLSAVAIAAAAAPLSVTADPPGTSDTGVPGSGTTVTPSTGGGIAPDAGGGNNDVSPTGNTQTLNPEKKSGTANMLYSVNPTYTITIPQQIVLEDTAKTVTITASDVVIHDSAKIIVKINKDAEYKLNHSTKNTSYITYKIKKDETDLLPAGTAAEFTGNGTQDLFFTVDDKSNATVAGDCTGTLAFDIEYYRPTAPVIVDPGHTT